jgi:hypothetical protein
VPSKRHTLIFHEVCITLGAQVLIVAIVRDKTLPEMFANVLVLTVTQCRRQTGI